MATLNRIIVGVLGLVVLLMPACKSDEGGISGVKRDDADALNAQHSYFDNANDPPFQANTWFAAGQLAESQNAPANAIEAYNRALKSDPKHLPSLYRLGVLWAQLKQHNQAILAWERYVKASDGDATGYSNLGFCYELAGRPEEAQKAYEQGLAKDPKNEPCRVNLGLMLARAGRHNEALLQLQQVLPPAQAHYNLGSLYEHQGKIQQAKAEYRKALELDPASAARARIAALD